MKRKKTKKQPTADDLLKYEIASNLGLSSKIDSLGWGGLTAAETGRIGGLLSSRKRQMKKQTAKDSQASQSNTIE